MAQWDWLSVSHCLVMQTATSAAFCVTLWYVGPRLLYAAPPMRRHPYIESIRCVGTVFLSCAPEPDNYVASGPGRPRQVLAPCRAATLPHLPLARRRYWVGLVAIVGSDLAESDASTYLAHAGGRVCNRCGRCHACCVPHAACPPWQGGVASAVAVTDACCLGGGPAAVAGPKSLLKMLAAQPVTTLACPTARGQRRCRPPRPDPPPACRLPRTPCLPQETWASR